VLDICSLQSCLIRQFASTRRGYQRRLTGSVIRWSFALHGRKGWARALFR